MHTILFPVNELRIGGAEQQLLELVRGLDKSRFRPIVAPLYAGALLESEFRAVPGAEVVDLGRRGKYDFAPLWSVAALLRQRQVDVVQPFLSPATFFGLLPALVAGTAVKVVTERCGVRRVRHLGYKLYRTAEDRLTRLATAVVANSEAGRSLLLERGIPAERVRVIYNGINRERLVADATAVAAVRARIGGGDGAQVVGILASLTAPKDHATLLRAVARCAPARPGVRLALVGDGPLRGELEDLAGRLGLADRVTFCGYQRRVSDYLAACDLLVSSSRDNEGCSNSILEAMFLGVPVAATDVGGNRELIADGTTGFLTPVGNDEALAATMERALDDPAGTRAVAERAREMVERRFGLERMVTEYETLYTELLATPRRGALHATPAR